LDLTDDSCYAIMKDLEERQQDNLGWRTRCRDTMQEERGGCIPGSLFREFQSAGFKWLKKDFGSQTVNGYGEQRSRAHVRTQ